MAAKFAMGDGAVVLPRPMIRAGRYMVADRWECNHADVWAGRDRELWATRVRNMDVVHDIPFVYCYKEMARMYPDAKFVLAKRDGKQWFDSFRRYQDKPGAVDPSMLNDWFGVERLEEATRGAAIDVMQNHNDNVETFFRGTGRLLTLEMPLTAEHHDKLVRFLGVPTDAAAPLSFPEINTFSTTIDGMVVFSDPKAFQRIDAGERRQRRAQAVPPPPLPPPTAYVRGGRIRAGGRVRAPRRAAL